MTRDRKTANAGGIAIIGIGALFPDSIGLKEYWRLISRGEDAITDVPETHWSAADYYRENPAGGDYVYCKRGGFLPSVPYDPTEFNMPPNLMEATDTSQLLGLLVAKRALADAGYGDNNSSWDRERTGVILGATGTQELVIPLASRLGFPKWRRALEKAGVPAEQAQYVIEQIAHDYVPWQESSFPGLLGNVIAGRIANRLDLGGTNCVIDAACASSLSAINLAVLELMAGRADMMITGGIDTLNDIFMHMCFSKTFVLSFSGDARPFSKDADGTVLGEGLGLFVLKRLEDAEKDNDRIYAVIDAVGTSSDGRSAGIYAPVARGQVRALQRAYENGGIDPATVDLVEAHGTGTRVGDAVEFEALAGVYREADDTPARCALGSVKSMIGHTKAAAGSASMAKVALALYHKVIPPTLKVDEPDPKLDIDNSPFYISTTLRPWLTHKKSPRRAGLSSFGFGGSNFHMVMSEYQPEKPQPAWDGSVEIVAASGPSKADIFRQLNEFVQTVQSHAEKEGGLFRGIGLHAPATREAFNAAHSHRAMIIVERGDDVIGVIHEAINTLTETTDGLITGKKLIYGTSEGENAVNPGKTAFIFPGQGSQYIYMARDLVCLFPEAHRVFELADAQFAKFRNAGDKPLSDYVYPPGFREAHKKAAEEALRSTDIAQPAIGAASLAMARVLQRFNITADAACGHSFGELTALCAAGWMDDETFLSLAAARGKYMAAAGKEKGAMLAVKGDLLSIERLIADNGLDLVLANRNSPDQGVLSGRESEIDRAAAICKENRMRATRLPVSAAFHTELVQDAAKPFKEYLRKKELTISDIPVFSNTTAAAYPADPGEARKVLGSQILNPVNFIDEIQAMYADGVDTFLEIGPKTVMAGLVKAILKGKPFHALSVDASTGRKSGTRDLAQTLCFFAALGQPVLLHNWEGIAEQLPAEQKMSIPLCGANYVRERPPLPEKTFAPAVDAEPASGEPAPGREPAVSMDSNMVKDALKVVSDSLKSMQALQQQTADAHRRFLDTQSEAGKALGVVMEKTRSLSESVLGGRRIESSAFTETSQAAPARETAKERPASPSPAAAPPSPEPSPEPVPAMAEIPATPAAGSNVDAGRIETAMLDIVSRVTGYPVDMLTLDMDIENDLGIDSIKRVEILSVFEEEHPDIPSAAPEDLAEMRTMGEICKHLIGLAGAGGGDASAAAGGPSGSGVPAGAIETAMLDIVSRVTGYPVDMLTLDMDIENDLGIDSIKRVEILSVFEEEQPDIPSAAPEDLAEMRTMGEICTHLIGLAGGAPAAESFGTEQPQAETAAAASTATITAKEDAPVPRRTIRLLDRPLEIGNTLTPASNAPVFIFGNTPKWGQAIGDALKKKGVATTVLTDLSDAPDFSNAAGLVVAADMPVTEGELWTEMDEGFIKDAFELVTRAAPCFAEKQGPEKSAVFAVVTAMDGALGFGGGTFNPLQAALFGLVKTAAIEWEAVACHAIDVDPEWKSDPAAAGAVAAEILALDGPVEAGLSNANRRVIALEPSDYPQGTPDLGPGDVVLISGGARGVTAQCAIALARETGAAMVLLGRTPLPEPEPEWLNGLTDEPEIKKVIMAHLFAGQKPTPVGIDHHYRRYMGAREITATLETLNQNCRKVAYYPVDVRDTGAVRKIIDEVRQSIGPISAIIHGAGVLEDRFIADKTREQFEKVFDTKVMGLNALLSAAKDDPLRYIVLFSSVSARMGNKGQADYAMANEVLNKIAQRLASTLPNCRSVAVNWGPWDGGMVTPSLRREFEKNNIRMIPLAAGARCMMAEMAGRPGEDTEVVIGAGFADLAEDAAGERSATALPAKKKNGLSTAFERAISLESLPVLQAHKLDGTPVVPFALAFEWLGSGALHANPGLLLAGIDNMRVTAGIKLNGTSASIAVLAGKARKNGNAYEVDVEIRNADADADMLYYTASAVLAQDYDAPPSFTMPADLAKRTYGRSQADIYDTILFHGEALHGIQTVMACTGDGISAELHSAPEPRQWIQDPLRNVWLADPLVLDAAFQMAIIWCYENTGMVSLPVAFDAFRQYRQAFPADGVRAVLAIKNRASQRIRGDITFLDSNDTVVATMTGYEAVMDKTLANAFKNSTTTPAFVAGWVETNG
ncbi:MAG: SDR family oxidoreductase [Thermodesulfobacteriota bacterium]|nr:SDR family oxidoreductase [Thermodesulfobacteriota bacterium]